MPHLRVKKIGIASVRSLFGNPETFTSVCQQRNISFAYQGMRIEVSGKMGTIVGANNSSNLDVVFDGEWHVENCHPGWKTRYYDANGNVVQDNTAPGEGVI
ncbi:hypothetical protein D2Q93_04345 [Alicyclobacillaceae bacterium I2511]|nr:hypothetical protein D2Q93_04345 [Alicyclobacillaceae bacterium I2511]